MKIVLDISRLHPAALKRGVGFYSLNLFQALSKINDENDYFLKKKKDQYLQADLFHYPYFDPFFITLPLWQRTASVVTIHDLIPLKFPEHYPSGIKGFLKLQVQKKIVRNKTAIITDSENSKKDIIDLLKICKEKVFSIPLAVGEEFKKLNRDNLKEEIKHKYNLNNQFIVYVGDLNWNKNVPGLIKSFAVVSRRMKKIDLVLIGSAFQKKELQELKEVKKLIEKLQIKDRIKILGFLEIEELVKLYNCALFYVQPSFYEGFGLPVLEAMSCGCPVLTSNQASLPEVGSNAVEYFNPFEKEKLENKLFNLLKNRKRLKILSQKGLKRSRSFSWKKTALETREIYQKITFYS